MKSLTIPMIFLTMIMMLVVMPGCKKDEGVVQPPDQLAPPTNLRALSKDGAVQLTWDASSFAGNADFAIYRITTTGSPNRVDSTTNTTIIIPNLNNGISYTFSVQTVRNDGALSVGDSVIWGPTMRYYTIRIYEFASANPSGLEFSTGDTLHFTSGGVNGDNRNYIDLWIDGRSGAEPVLKSPHTYDPTNTWRETKFAPTSATGLDEYVAVPGAAAFSSSLSLSTSATFVYFAVTQDGNYVRFTSSPVQGAFPDRYVDIDAAYNAGGGHWAKIAPKSHQ